MNLEIKNVTVLQRYGCDMVYVTTTVPSPLFKNKPLSLTFETEKGKGAEYVRKHFDTEPEVVIEEQ